MKLSYGPRPEEETPAAPAMRPGGDSRLTSPAAHLPCRYTCSVTPGRRRNAVFCSTRPVQAQVSAPVVVGLQVDNACRSGERYPSNSGGIRRILRLNQVTPAGLLAQPGKNPPSLDIRNDTGEATIEMSRARRRERLRASDAVQRSRRWARAPARNRERRSICANSKQQADTR